MKAPIPKNEGERIKALYESNILDTVNEEIYDLIVEMARLYCGTSIAAISLIDVNRQWFKAIKGLDITETNRDVAFCAHTILGSDVLVVNDATIDERFKKNLLVTGEPHIRFYAGSPIVKQNGINIGSLCVIDQEPKIINEDQKSALNMLSRMVVLLVDSRREVTNMNNIIKFYVNMIEIDNKRLSKTLKMQNIYSGLYDAVDKMIASVMAATDLTQLKTDINEYKILLSSGDLDHMPKQSELTIKGREILNILSGREIDVLKLVVVGRPTKKISSMLDISPKTVGRHIENMCKKFNCHSKSDLVTNIYKYGLYLTLLGSKK